VAEVSADTAHHRFVTTQALPHDQWQQVVLTLNAQRGNLSLYRNGQLLQAFRFAPGAVGWQPTPVLLGKHPATQRQGPFDLNVLNGVLDDVVLLARPLTAAQVAQGYRPPAAAPDLRIPASRFAGDYLRPRYHPSPAANWCNEAHGLLYHAGYYHLFYQKNGNGPYWSRLNWGHLRSRDLLAWEEVGVALWPEPDSFDKEGTWSGHLVVGNEGKPTIIYTGVDGVKAAIAGATSDNSLLSWQKLPQNPLVAGAPAAYPHHDFRDPYVFRESGVWNMVVGSGLTAKPQDEGTVFLYQSSDLQQWKLVGPLFVGQPATDFSGTFWEMPVFWKFGAQHLLLVNKVPQPGQPARALYWVGDFKHNQFTPSQPATHNLEVLNALLSPAVNTDARGRVIAIGIIPDQLRGQETFRSGYANVFGLPRTWQLQHGRLYQAPHPNLTRLRETSTRFTNLRVTPEGNHFLGSAKGWQLELRATMQPQVATQQAGFILGANADGTEQTRVYYDYQAHQLVVDRSHSSTNPHTPHDILTEPLALPAGQAIDWHIFTDGSAIEVFINNELAFATRMYPASAASNGVDAFVRGGSATLRTTQVWQLRVPTLAENSSASKKSASITRPTN
jgi:beta-fructofuranosidase